MSEDKLKNFVKGVQQAIPEIGKRIKNLETDAFNPDGYIEEGHPDDGLSVRIGDINALSSGFDVLVNSEAERLIIGSQYNSNVYINADSLSRRTENGVVSLKFQPSDKSYQVLIPSRSGTMLLDNDIIGSDGFILPSLLRDEGFSELQLGSYINATTFHDESGVAYTPDDDYLYIDTSTNIPYRWTGSAYIKVGDGGVVIGETSQTAGRGDWALIAYNHSQAKSSQAEAEAGVENTKWASSLRVANYVDAQVGDTNIMNDLLTALGEV